VTAISPTAMGFGSNQVLAPPSSSVQFGHYAFTIPTAGTLSNLQASVDVHFTPSTAQVAWTYVFTIYRSPCVGGIVDPTIPYTSTGLVATTTLPATSTITYPIGQYVSACGTAAGPIAVAAGDRIVLVLTSDQPGAPPAIDEIGFSAGVFCTTP